MENTLKQTVENWKTSFADGKKQIEVIDTEIKKLERQREELRPKISCIDSLLKPIAKALKNYKLGYYGYTLAIYPSENDYNSFAIEFYSLGKGKTIKVKFATQKHYNKYGTDEVFLLNKEKQFTPIPNTIEELYDWVLAQNE
jgi:hypothetical protein